MLNAKWKMVSGKWEVGSGKWQVARKTKSRYEARKRVDTAKKPGIQVGVDQRRAVFQ